MCDDRGACGECMRFENSPEVLGGDLIVPFTAIFGPEDGDETNPIATAQCMYAQEDDPLESWICEDTPACEHKIECCPRDVSGIVACWLVENGFDALINPDDECGCDADDIMPCSYTGSPDSCQPAYAYHCEWCLDSKICQIRHRGFADEPYTTYSTDPELCHPNYMPPFKKGGSHVR